MICWINSLQQTNSHIRIWCKEIKEGKVCSGITGLAQGTLQTQLLMMPRTLGRIENRQNPDINSTQMGSNGTQKK